jgi:hypothetical protein
MNEPFGFKCVTCGEYHVGMPSFGWDYPVQYLLIPEEERERRIELSSEGCIIDEKWFFVRGCLEMPVGTMRSPFRGVSGALSVRTISCATESSPSRSIEMLGSRSSAGCAALYRVIRIPSS